jgi:hypothetical protein
VALDGLRVGVFDGQLTNRLIDDEQLVDGRSALVTGAQARRA